MGAGVALLAAVPGDSAWLQCLVGVALLAAVPGDSAWLQCLVGVALLAAVHGVHVQDGCRWGAGAALLAAGPRQQALQPSGCVAASFRQHRGVACLATGCMPQQRTSSPPHPLVLSPPPLPLCPRPAGDPDVAPDGCPQAVIEFWIGMCRDRAAFLFLRQYFPEQYRRLCAAFVEGLFWADAQGCAGALQWLVQALGHYSSKKDFVTGECWEGGGG